MTLITPIFYIAGGIISGAVAFSVFLSYKKSEDRGLLFLSIAAIFLMLHAFFLSIPTLINKNDLPLIAWGYIFGIVCLFSLFISGLRVQTLINKNFLKDRNPILNIIIILLGIIVTWLLVSDFRLPIIDNSGVIFWNINKIASWIIGGVSLLYGLMWTDFFQQTGLMVKNKNSKIKMGILSIDGVVLGISALLVFTSTNVVQTIIGHMLFVGVVGATLFVFIFDRKN